MTALLTRFDDWAAHQPVSDRDLSIGRILYAAIGLLTIWRSDFAAQLPVLAFRPPPGPFQLLAAPPPGWVISGMTLALALAFALLLVGALSRIASIAAALLLIALFGLGYSFGKIDHTIMLAVVPLIMAWSGWATHFSLDSLRRSPRRVAVQRWAPRALALALGVSFATAGWAKLASGWLDPTTQSAQGYFSVLTAGTTDPIKVALTQAHWPGAWEAVDVATVVLELGLVLAALDWRAFRVVVAAATLFHFGILLSLGISFFYNIPAYALVVPWYSVLLFRVREWRLPRAGIVALLVAVPVLAVAAWKASSLPNSIVYSVTGHVLVVAAAAAGAAYLVRVAGSATRSLIARASARATARPRAVGAG